MDIRSIIDSEDTPPPRRPSASTPVKQDYRPIPPRPPTAYEAQQPIYDNRREVRPPQPSPLQTHGKSDLQYPNGPVQNTTIENTSPWRHTSSVGSNSGPYAPPQSVSQSPIRGHPPPQYTQRENHSASAAVSTRSFGHSTPLSQTPTSSTPGSAGAYSNFPRPTSSHSIPTPSSAQYPPNVLRESPQPSQMRIISQSQPSQQYMSQPGTPLGPPSTFRRASFNPVRESPGTHDRQRNLSGGSFSQPQSATPSPATAGSPQIYREQRSQSSIHGHSRPREREKSLSVSPKTRLPSLPSMDRREPLEAIPNQAPPWAGHAAPAKRKAEREPSDVVMIEPPRLNRTPSRVTSFGVNGLLNAGPPDEAQQRVASQQQIECPLTKAPDYRSSASTQFKVNERPPAYQSQSSFDHLSGLLPSTPSAASVQNPGIIRPATPPTSDRNSKISSQITSNRESSMPAMIEAPTAHYELNESPSQSVKKVASWKLAANSQATQSIKAEGIGAPDNGIEQSSEPVKKKIRLGDSPKESVLPSIEKPLVRTAAVPTASQSTKTKPPRISRWQDVPVYAQSVRGPKRTAELFALSLQRRATEQRVVPPNQMLNKAPISQTPGQVNGVPNANNHTPPVNGVRMPVAQPALANNGPLGPWEPSILNIIPSEELTRVISDWLFEHVVLREDVGVGPAGGAADQGAVIEIEAKIGQLMDKNTNDRIRIPVLNECVVSHTDPNLKIAFKSSMTEAQHRTLNQFLNKALVDSKQPPKAASGIPPKPRIPMSYKHTYETDTFYELSQAGALQLPRSIASGVQYNPRAANKPKVRITTDQKTGKEIAKIIKARVADIDVYSPRTAFDWRVSVNVEMNFDGDMRGLVETDRRDGKKADRNKDRMSYKHLAYQVDLTQVTPADATSKTDKEHELEIEVSSEEVRRQGLLAKSGQISQYEDLIRGFVDNVRVLARHCQP